MGTIAVRWVDVAWVGLLGFAAACGPAVDVAADATGTGTPAETAADVDGDTRGVDTTSSTRGDAEGDDATGATGSGGSEGAAPTGDGDASTGSASTGSASAGCERLDLLFVIDNSGSMADEQANLMSVLPSVLATLESVLGEDPDVHIMVTDVDADPFALCDPGCACTDAEGVCDSNAAPECLFDCTTLFACQQWEGFSCDLEPLACEPVLGAGVTHPRGDGASNVDCGFTSGGRYIDGSQPDLEAALSCAVGLGTGSLAPTERPMEAMVAAVSGVGEVGACNDGWLRDDAPLVVTFITDESDDADEDSAGTPATWHQALLDAKGGDASAVVVLGLFGDNDMPGGVCEDLGDNQIGAEAAPRLRQFLDAFGKQARFGSVCQGSYAAFFEDAATLIDATCDGFVAP